MEGTDLRALAALYVMGLLPAPEQATLEATLPQRPELAAVVAEMRGERGAPSGEGEALDRLMQQVQADEAQRDRVAADDPALHTDLIELLALYRALSERLAAHAEAAPLDSGA